MQTLAPVGSTAELNSSIIYSFSITKRTGDCRPADVWCRGVSRSGMKYVLSPQLFAVYINDTVKGKGKRQFV